MTANSNSDVESGQGLDILKWVVVTGLMISAITANQVFDEVWVLYRALGVVAAIGLAGFTALQTTKGKQFICFANESKLEVRKMIWPSRQEATNTTLIVFVVTCLFGLILWGLDSLLVSIVNLILGI
jgi:preprotein translocase subunit SecE